MRPYSTNRRKALQREVGISNFGFRISNLGSAILATVELEWDPDKAEMNAKQHGVSFQEAATVFGDALSMTVPDSDHSFEEFRYITVGLSHYGRPLIVSTERGDRIRIMRA